MPDNRSEVSKTPLTVKGLWNTENPSQAIEFHVLGLHLTRLGVQPVLISPVHTQETDGKHTSTSPQKGKVI